MSPSELLVAAAATPLAEVAYRDVGGRWRAVVLPPLTADGAVTFALPYAERTTAAALAAAGEVVVVCSDARPALRGWRPLGVVGAVALEEDPTGERFRGALLGEELRKHPPSRLLADSLIAQREHWWFLPRLLVRVTAVHRAWPVGARAGVHDGVLLGDGAVPATTVSVVADEGDRLVLQPLAGGPLPAGPVTLLRHDVSLPDMEERSLLLQHGEVDGAALVVERSEGTLDLPDPAGLLVRYRRARAFERACRRALAAAGS